ncbi:putative bifunctional diguanylate cyclase/phosphodiesterase [Novosphingobium acidiphilum]|uniref:putative bifunctional diguanylate cyclase/phosphodiesterase n=1 Tax=Novosphingobium acidiphilum TaxID=505248 RepID=UPI000412C8EB|nr:EAL domain-containing protein [Novosphingobium acidiphilum]
MNMLPFPVPPADKVQLERLERQLLRERKARHAAEAIAENGLRELYESKRFLALLQRITERANHAETLTEAMAFALGEICAEMGWDFGNAYLVRSMQEAVACDCWHVANPEHLMAFVEVSRDISFARGVGLPGRVITQPRAHWVNDVRTDDNFIRREAAINCRVVAGCAFPIMAGSEVVAVYEFYARKTIEASEVVVETIAQIGIQLGRVAEREHAREALLRDALHDPLTTLPNRVLLNERASSAFARLPPKGKGLAVLVIDLDGFKGVNDKLGHHAGDCLLVATAARLRDAIDDCVGGESVWRPSSVRPKGADRALRTRATLARTGGDEFVVLLENVTDDRLPEVIADALQAELALPFSIGRDEVAIGASIGIARSNASYHDYDEIQRDADLAMYEAKAGGRGKTVTFTPLLGSAVRDRMAVERDLREAIREDQFVLHFQAILDLSAGTVEGYEALVRWNHPERGLVAPGDFIPTAEATGLIIFIGDWVLREACRAIARLHAQLALGTAPDAGMPWVAVNIAPQQFLQPDFIPYLRSVIMETGVPAQCLKLEVTEGVAVLDAERTRRVLEQCREIGIRVGLDDFGTGYSSLSYLHSLPFDTIKIDRAFVAAMDQPKSRKIVRTILDLAANLELTVVAEGIETADQQAALTAMGCGMGQGFLLSLPLEEIAAFDLLAEGSPYARGRAARRRSGAQSFKPRLRPIHSGL